MRLADLTPRLKDGVLTFNCPVCCGDAEHTLRVRVGTVKEKGMWKMSGEFPGITLEPSVDAGCWHGEIINGKITGILGPPGKAKNMGRVKDVEPEKPYQFQAYPRAVKDPRSGKVVVVPDHLHEEAVTGVRMNEDGTPFVDVHGEEPEKAATAGVDPLSGLFEDDGA